MKSNLVFRMIALLVGGYLIVVGSMMLLNVGQAGVGSEVVAYLGCIVLGVLFGFYGLKKNKK